MWSPIHASFGTIGADAHTELSEQVREVSGYMVARYGLGAEPYLVMLLSEVSAMSGAYQALTGSEFDVSWWPDDAAAWDGQEDWDSWLAAANRLRSTTSTST